MGAVLMLAFLLVPVIEIYVIVQVGQEIGAPLTVALLLFESLLGAWIVRREGARAWRALRDGIGVGRMPSRELLDAALVLIGGTLLLTPGFVSDIFGFFFVLPFTRPLARAAVTWYLARRVDTAVRRMAAGAGGGGGARRAGPLGRAYGGRIVSGEVIEPEDRRGP
jgi:UPF0716 protein FxsA